MVGRKLGEKVGGMNNRPLTKTRQSRLGIGWLVIAVVTTAIAGCGFHLRGNIEVPEALRTVYLSSENPGSGLTKRVRQSMRASGISLTANSAAAPYTLYLLDERMEKRSISVDSIAAAAEFQLRQLVSYEVRDINNRLLIGPLEVISERNFQNDINNVVGKRDEERLILEEMQVHLASQIMRRYQSIDVTELERNTQ